jgi:hypothetical protein
VCVERRGGTVVQGEGVVARQQRRLGPSPYSYVAMLSSGRVIGVTQRASVHTSRSPESDAGAGGADDTIEAVMPEMVSALISLPKHGPGRGAPIDELPGEPCQSTRPRPRPRPCPAGSQLFSFPLLCHRPPLPCLLLAARCSLHRLQCSSCLSSSLNPFPCGAVPWSACR